MTIGVSNTIHYSAGNGLCYNACWNRCHARNASTSTACRPGIFSIDIAFDIQGILYDWIVRAHFHQPRCIPISYYERSTLFKMRSRILSTIMFAKIISLNRVNRGTQDERANWSFCAKIPQKVVSSLCGPWPLDHNSTTVSSQRKIKGAFV